MTEYVQKIGGYFYYRRRIPVHLEKIEKRKFIKVSLGTKNEREAIRKAAIYNDYIEEFWRSQLKKDNHDNYESEYKAAILLAKSHGFTYKTAIEVAQEPLTKVIERLEVVDKSKDKEQYASALLGGKNKPDIKLTECLEKFWPLSSDKIVNKTEHQIRKWKNPRKASVSKFIDIIGNKFLSDVTRTDILKFRQWWMDRIADESAIANTANKCMTQVRDVLKTVALAYELETDFDALFSNTRLKETEQSRPPFEAAYVQNILLKENALKGLNLEARMLIYAMADTGARESELIGLSSEDIMLDSSIPYIWIRPKKNSQLKTLTSERQIPLVGASLYAFSQLPKGFSRYSSSDSASATINKYLRENKLRPSDKHSLYSLRHTFKDRLRDAGAPEEVIDELMGHKTRGPKYGRGHILDVKHKWLEKIKFKISENL